MDHLADHSSICTSGFGGAHQNQFRNVFVHEVFCPAGLSAQLQAPLLISGINLRPAIVLVQPPAMPPGAALGNAFAYYIIVHGVKEISGGLPLPWRSGEAHHFVETYAQ